MSTRLTRTLVSFLAALALGLVPVAVLAQDAAPAPVVVQDAEGNDVLIADASRVVTLGGVITETAYALGAADQVLAVDASSFYPPEAQQEKPVLGYYRQLSAEPILAAGPSLVLGTDEVGPPEVVEQLRAAGVVTLLLPRETSVEGARALITSVGTALGRQAEAGGLVAALEADLARANDLLVSATSAPRVLFVLNPPGAPLLVSGSGTAADAMIALAGGTNASVGFPGYVPLSAEAVLAAAPDVILTTTSSLEALGGVEGLVSQPGLAQTPAAESGRIVALEDLYLLEFGPRTGQAVEELVLLLHPELAE